MSRRESWSENWGRDWSINNDVNVDYDPYVIAVIIRIGIITTNKHVWKKAKGNRKIEKIIYIARIGWKKSSNY